MLRMKIFFYLATIILLNFIPSGRSYGQVDDSRKYRVIAYKAGQPEIYSISNEIDVVPGISLFIPNAFTPNGDGLNDTFGVSGEAIKEFHIKIFNRWGEIIFETQNAKDRWDGTYMGEQVPEGTYTYMVTAAGVSGKRQSREGKVKVVL